VALASGAPETGSPAAPGVGAACVAAPGAADTLEAVVRTRPVAEGVAAEGAAAEGVVAEGTVPTGVDTRGVVTDGTVTDGVVAEGVVAVGVVTFGVVTAGVVATGVLTGGTVADGTVAEGTVTVGTDRVGAAAPAACCGNVAATPASGCAASTPSPAAAIPTTRLRRLPMACPLHVVATGANADHGPNLCIALHTSPAARLESAAFSGRRSGCEHLRRGQPIRAWLPKRGRISVCERGCLPESPAERC
jgi:hypothetical protein